MLAHVLESFRNSPAVCAVLPVVDVLTHIPPDCIRHRLSSGLALGFGNASAWRDINFLKGSSSDYVKSPKIAGYLLYIFSFKGVSILVRLGTKRQRPMNDFIYVIIEVSSMSSVVFAAT